MSWWQETLKLLRSFSLNICRTHAYRGNTAASMPFYAVARGRTPGIFMTWADCEAQVKGFSGARYKKFDVIGSAQDFILAEGGGGGVTTSKKTKTASKQQTQNNLKRSYSTNASNNQRNSGVSKPKPNSKPAREPSPSDDDDYVSNNQRNSGISKPKPKSKPVREPSPSDDDDYVMSENDDSSELDDSLNSMIVKQLDDIEQRLKGFEKGIDKIIKKNTTGTKSSGKKSLPQPSSSQRKPILIEPPQPKRRKSTNMEFVQDADGYVEVYTDGACSANGKHGAKAGFGVYWGDGHSLNTSEPVSGRATNNCGEIQAASCAIRQALQNGIPKLAINTDSKFVINAVTKWIRGWKNNGWKLKSGEPVKNEVDFKELDALQDKLYVKWVHVHGHSGDHGNEMADQLAKAGAAKYNNK